MIKPRMADHWAFSPKIIRVSGWVCRNLGPKLFTMNGPSVVVPGSQRHEFQLAAYSARWQERWHRQAGLPLCRHHRNWKDSRKGLVAAAFQKTLRGTAVAFHISQSRPNGKDEFVHTVFLLRFFHDPQLSVALCDPSATRFSSRLKSISKKGSSKDRLISSSILNVVSS